MVIVFNCFQIIIWSNVAVYQGHINWEKKYQKVHNLQDKTGCQKYKVAFEKLIPTNFSILMPIKFKN